MRMDEVAKIEHGVRAENRVCAVVPVTLLRPVADRQRRIMASLAGVAIDSIAVKRLD